MQVQGYVHGQSKQLNLSMEVAQTVENAVFFLIMPKGLGSQHDVDLFFFCPG